MVTINADLLPKSITLQVIDRYYILRAAKALSYLALSGIYEKMALDSHIIRLSDGFLT